MVNQEILQFIKVTCHIISSHGRLDYFLTCMFRLTKEENIKAPHHVAWPSFFSGSDLSHYNDVIMGAMASQITSITIVSSTVYSGADQRKKSNLRVTGLCVGNSQVTGEFPAQRASNAENVSN